MNRLTVREINEIIERTNHTSRESIQEFVDNGMIEILDNYIIFLGYVGNDNIRESLNDSIILETGKVIYFIGG